MKNGELKLNMSEKVRYAVWEQMEKSLHFSLDSFNYLTQTYCKTQQPLTLHEIILTFFVKF